MDYQPVIVEKRARPAKSKHSTESRYWRQFKHPVFAKEYAPVTAVHFSPTKPHRYAVTASTRVQIYAPRTQKITKTISRFKDIARSANIRPDGKLLIAGDDTGLIQVCRVHFFAIYLNSIPDHSLCPYRYSTSILERFSEPLMHTSSQCMSPNSHYSTQLKYYLVRTIVLCACGMYPPRKQCRPLQHTPTM
jgi:hypothetical protein